MNFAVWENEPMVVRCKFPVISYLCWVWGKYQKKEKIFFLETGKEKARNPLHMPDNILEKKGSKEVFSHKIQL